MATDQRTSNYKFKKPYPDNRLIDDVERLRQALDGIDAQFKKLSTVAWTGEYGDLKHIVSQVQTDWKATSGLASIKNRPNLAAVATSGQYNDLKGLPDISSMISAAILAKVPKSVGSTVKGVYTNAQGVVSPMTYELRKSVPANAIFTDHLVETVAINPTSGTWYGIPFGETSVGTRTLGINDGLRYHTLQGTQNTEGHSYLQLGNSAKKGAANNKTGHYRLYGANSGYGQIDYANSTANTTHTLPATSGTLLNSGTTSFTQSLKSGVEIGKIKINGTEYQIFGRDTVTKLSSTDGSGNAVTNIEVTNGDIKVTKASTFSLSNHSHGSLLYPFDLAKGTNPKSNLYHELISYDNSGKGSSQAYRFAMVGRSINTEGRTSAYLTAYDSTLNSTKSATVGVFYPKGGTPYATAPSTRASGPASTEIVTYDFLNSRYVPLAGANMLGRLNLYKTADPDDSSKQAASTEFVQKAITSALRNIFELVWSAMPLSDAGLHLLDGAVLPNSGVYTGFITEVANQFAKTKPTAVTIPLKRIVLPKFKANKQDGITISDARGNTTDLQRMFNGSIVDYVDIGEWNTYWINIDYAQNTLLRSYTLQADSLTNPEHPTAWTVKGSNDGSSWTTIDSRSGITFNLGETKTFNVNPTTAYKQYRIVFSAGAQTVNYDKKGRVTSINRELKHVSFDAYATTTGYRNCAFATEEQWQDFVKEYGSCGKFVYDSKAKTVRLPKVSDILKGTSSLSAVGELTEAGLPNITGEVEFTSMASMVDNSNIGALHKSRAGHNGSYGDTWRDGSRPLIRFDASDSDAIYGNSNTVQPQTINGLLYIVIANRSKTVVEVNINNVITDLNAKMDKAGCTVSGAILSTSLTHVVNNTRSTGDTYIGRAKRTDTGYEVSFGIGSGGQNRGIYDTGLGWIINRNGNGDVTLNANNGSTSKQFKASADGTLSWSGTTIHTSSDERLKTPLESVSDAELDAWGDVVWGKFQFLDAVENKGSAARYHLGLIAQSVDRAFQSKGLDACKFGILCHEERMADIDEEGNIIPAFEQWMVRYDEAQAMEAIYQRREINRLKEENKALKALTARMSDRLAAIEERLSI